MLNKEEKESERQVSEKALARANNRRTPEERYEAACEFLNDADNPAAEAFVKAFHEAVREGKHFDPVRSMVYITDDLEEEYTPYEVKKFWAKYRIGSAAVIRLLRENFPESWECSTIRACGIDFIEPMRKKLYGNTKTAETFESVVNSAD